MLICDIYVHKILHKYIFRIILVEVLGTLNEMSRQDPSASSGDWFDDRTLRNNPIFLPSIEIAISFRIFIGFYIVEIVLEPAFQRYKYCIFLKIMCSNVSRLKIQFSANGVAGGRG